MFLFSVVVVSIFVTSFAPRPELGLVLMIYGAALHIGPQKERT